MPKVPYDYQQRASCDYDARVAEDTVRRNFGVKDRLGREIGGIAYRFRETFTEVPEGQTYHHRGYAPGQYFAFNPHASRNGREYGALQKTQYFTDAESRDAAVELYFRNAEKRALRR